MSAVTSAFTDYIYACIIHLALVRKFTYSWGYVTTLSYASANVCVFNLFVSLISLCVPFQWKHTHITHPQDCGYL